MCYAADVVPIKFVPPVFAGAGLLFSSTFILEDPELVLMGVLRAFSYL